MARYSMDVKFSKRLNGEKITEFQDIDAIIPYAGEGGYPGVFLRTVEGKWLDIGDWRM